MAIPQAQKRYLKVETPKTTDGKTLKYDDERKVVYKTSFLPITAKAELLRNTSKLPEYLRPIITEMSGDANAQNEIIAEQQESKEAIQAESGGSQQMATPATKPKAAAKPKSSANKPATQKPAAK